VPRSLKSLIARLVTRLPRQAGRSARRSFLAVDHSVEAMLFDNFAAIGLSAQGELLSPRLAALATYERAYGPSMAYFNAVSDQGTLLDRLLYTDLKTYLVELLMKQDQMSMGASIESRVPFLDHHLVEFAAGLPPDRKLSGFATKRILREALRGVLPSQILDRPKMGFPVPIGQWLRTGWSGVARDVLLDRRSRERGIFAPAAVERLLAGMTVAGSQAADAVWSLMNVELWYRTFVDGEGIQTLPAPARVETLRSAS
jgi:asparagine synthase (glutamine-hydrolysing)